MVGHVTQMSGKKNAYRILGGKVRRKEIARNPKIYVGG
jgi:hypothetical protein